MAELSRFTPESYLPGFVYIPLFFKPVQTSYSLLDFQLELDSTGLRSVIRLVDSAGIRVTPFIDISKFDSETKDWYWYDSIDNLPFRFTNKSSAVTGTFKNMYPSVNTGLKTGMSIGTSQYSDVSGVWVSGYGSTTNSSLNNIFLKYTPILIVADNVPFTDLSDYSNISVTDNLDRTTNTPEFYYDFEERLYTNKDLGGYNPNDVKIVMYSVGINEVVVKCMFGSSSNERAKITPVIDDYVVKLKGQYLRS